APGRWRLRIEARTIDVDRRSRIERDRRQPGGRPAVGAMVEGAVIGAIERQAMDKPGTTIGDEELLRTRIEGESAERGHALCRGIDGRQQRHLAGDAVDTPDRARSATLLRRAELTGHELGSLGASMDSLDRAALVGNVDRNSVGGGCSE